VAAEKAVEAEEHTTVTGAIWAEVMANEALSASMGSAALVILAVAAAIAIVGSAIYNWIQA
jgi:hypothetical protein